MNVASSFGLVVVVSSLALGGCKKEAPKAPAAGAAQTQVAAPKAAEPAIVRATVGVAECDDWLKKVEACMAKDPAMKTRYMPGYKMMNESWPRNFAAGGATRAALAPGCKTSLDTLDAPCK